MPHCEMCGDEGDSLQKAKVSGAELEVCGDCAQFGTTLEDDDEDDSTSTKYSTSSSSEQNRQSRTQQSRNDSSGYSGMPGALAPNYGDLIRDARTGAGYSVSELADHLDEKASHLRKVEQGERQPDNNLQARLEDFLGVDLSMEDDFDPSQGDRSGF